MPWDSSSLTGRFAFVPDAAKAYVVLRDRDRHLPSPPALEKEVL